MSTLRTLLRLGVGATAVGLVIGYRVWIYPWRAPPPESPERVEALWHQVEREAAPVADPASPAGLPTLPSGSLSQVARVVSPENGLIPTRSAEEIGEAAAQAINSLLAWSAGSTGNDLEICSLSRHSPVLYMTLGRVALSRADFVASDPSLVGALRLGRALRSRETLVGYLVGLGIASSALRWARAHQVPMRGELATLAPTRNELIRALARNHVCDERMARNGSSDAHGFGRYLMNDRRELDMLHWYLGSIFDRALARQNDAEGVAAAYRVDGAEELPKSLLCRAVAMNADSPIRNAWLEIRDYEQAVAASGSPER